MLASHMNSDFISSGKQFVSAVIALKSMLGPAHKPIPQVLALTVGILKGLSSQESN